MKTQSQQIKGELWQAIDKWDRQKRKDDKIFLSFLCVSLVLFGIASALMFNVFWKWITLLFILAGQGG